MSLWYGFWAPHRHAAAIVIAKLNAAVQEALADPEVRARLTTSAWKSRRASSRRRQALVAHQKAEIDKWWPIIKAAGIKAQ